MSIHNFFNKIKENKAFDKTLFLFSVVIIAVALASFGLGRISSQLGKASALEGSIILVEGQESGFPSEREVIPEKRFVASKSGTKYYPLDCGGAKRIKEENKIWFATSKEAEKFGYTLSLTCK